jgi:hypothetical protein
MARPKKQPMIDPGWEPIELVVDGIRAKVWTVPNPPQEQIDALVQEIRQLRKTAYETWSSPRWRLRE